MFPDYIFESSWEVCNKVGGIYTVLSSRAKELEALLGDHLIFIGPDCWQATPCPYFEEDATMLAEWQKQAQKEGLKVRVGRWIVPGEPVAILVDFRPFFNQKNEIYGQLWNDFQVDSLHAYGDYDEASMFSYAAAKVVESYYKFALSDFQKVVYHGNEWMTGLGLLYIRKHLPQVATVFTTHATSIGRSIAGNNKPLYEYLPAYNGDQMAGELNMQSKHSIEKQTAWNVDCFTTVSDITATECRELMDKPVDFVLPNGFDDAFVPRGAQFTAARRKARAQLLRVANALTGIATSDNDLIVTTSGRYEFRNKGIDVFIDAISRLRQQAIGRRIVAFIEVPAWMKEAREDLKERLKGKKTVFDTALDFPFTTHWLNEQEHDRALGLIQQRGMTNAPTADGQGEVVIIFVPCYLTGDDGIFNMSYYDLLIGVDLAVYPSYYEPWGYTPLEAVAFKVPCITTTLAGFGLWAEGEIGPGGSLMKGVSVVKRTDYNYDEVADNIASQIAAYSRLTDAEMKKARQAAFNLSKKALWKDFIAYYKQAYSFALERAEQRKTR